ncbi:hypothetical protein DFH27DRAFT_615013 [Peziza echinospora]|nr:hypothetical protein DFH27DRAFT_615013 [Peziza echinospora]
MAATLKHDSFHGIATQQGVGDTVKSTTEWLVRIAQQQKWLIIFDNADERELDLTPYFPMNQHGNIIITSRNEESKTYAPQSHLHIGNLSADDSLEFFFKSSVMEQDEDNTATAKEELTHELGYLALAISHAAAHVRQHGTISEYLELLRTKIRNVLVLNLSNFRRDSKDNMPLAATMGCIIRKTG